MSLFRNIDPSFALEGNVRSIFRQEWEQAAPALCGLSELGEKAALLVRFQMRDRYLDMPFGK